MKHTRATLNREFRLSRVLAIAGVAIGSSLFAFPAAAAEPANHACLGTSFSALANPYFGQGVKAFAQQAGHPGLGDGIQALQAGVIPDLAVPNTCNDV